MAAPAAPAPLLELVNIQSRGKYRERPDGETEEVTWENKDQKHDGDVSFSSAQARLKSLKSETEAFIIFNNTSNKKVRALWLDFKGHEIAYSVIEPGIKKKYRTFVTHPWIVREVTTGRRMMLNDSMVVVGHKEEQHCMVTDAPRLPWSPKTHCFYPADFQASVRGLLLAYHHLSTGQDDITRPEAAPKPAPMPTPTPTTAAFFSPPRPKRTSLPSTPLMSPKQVTPLALLSPKMARTSIAAESAPLIMPAVQLLSAGADAALVASSSAGPSAGRVSPAGLCKGLTSRLISLCISPFLPKTVSPSQPEYSALGGAYEPSSLPAYPEPLDLSHDLTIQLDNPSMTSFTASEPIRAMRFEGSDDEAEAERQLQEELAAADVAVMADVLDVLTVRRSNSRARLHLGSLPHDLMWQILLASVPDTVLQDISLPQAARPDIKPAHLPEDPIKFEQDQAAAAEAAAAEAAAQGQAQAQAQMQAAAAPQQQ